jgi:CRISPR system Cascade subunit CasD
MQSWGSDSNFEFRRTNREPTKSGVIGMIAASMGRRRDESLDDLASLRFGVRVDQPGRVERDFHMVHKDKKTSYLTYRDYIHDAVFLVGFECEDKAFLESIEKNLRNPSFPLFLGRRSCPPVLPLVLGIRETGLLDTFKTEKSYASSRYKNNMQDYPIFVDTDGKGDMTAIYHDIPIAYDVRDRRYEYRFVQMGTVKILDIDEVETEHDPMAVL